MENNKDKKDKLNESDKQFNASFFRAYAIYGGMVSQLVVLIVLGVVVGKYLDQKLATHPLFLLIGVILGSVLGFINFFRMLTYYQRKQDKDGTS